MQRRTPPLLRCEINHGGGGGRRRGGGRGGGGCSPAKCTPFSLSAPNSVTSWSLSKVLPTGEEELLVQLHQGIVLTNATTKQKLFKMHREKPFSKQTLQPSGVWRHLLPAPLRWSNLKKLIGINEHSNNEFVTCVFMYLADWEEIIKVTSTQLPESLSSQF